jgi:nucleoside-diphosphate-sugar epimerase
MTKFNVLVTGCAGYIGTTLCASLLKQGHTVIGVDNLMFGGYQKAALLPLLCDHNFHFYQHDVRDDMAMNFIASKVDVVIPLAAWVGAPMCARDPIQATEVNWGAVDSLVRSLSKEQRVIFPNTNSGYGETDGSRFCTEEDPLNPISIYGISKCDAEKSVLDHPNSVVFRLATVFGGSPRMRFDLMVNDFAEKLYRTGKLEVFDPDFKRNFVGVKDVARAFIYAMCNHELNGVYNLGYPAANLTKIELAHKIACELNLSRESVTVGSGHDPDRRNYLVSNKKILDEGFEFKHTLEQGIKEVENICWVFKDNETRCMRNV